MQNSIRKFTLSVAGLACVVLSSAGAVSATAIGSTLSQRPSIAYADDITCNANRSVQVSGSATIEVVPDQAVIKFGIQAKGQTAEEAQSKVALASQNVIKALKAAGIEEKKISSDFYFAQPVYNNYDSRDITGFVVNYALGVQLADARKVNEIVATAFRAGATEVSSMELRSSQLRKYRDDARVAALTAASEKAQLLAKTAGAQIGCVLRIDEISVDSPMPYWYRSNAVSQNVMINASGPAQSNGGDTPAINLGTISIKADVNVSYSLK